MNKRLLVAGWIAVLLGWVLTACGTPPGLTAQVHDQPPSKDAQYAIAHFKARQANVQAKYYDETFRELLPNVLFSLDAKEPHALGKGIVVGDIVSVQPGKGYVVDGDDAVAGRPVAFDDPEALWRTMVVKVAVDDAWGYAPDTVAFGLAFGGKVDADRMLRGVREFGHVIAALAPQGKFEHDRSLYGIARNGAVLGLVDSAGRVALPILGELEATYLADVTTIESVEEAAHRPTTIIEFVGGVRTSR